MPPRAIHQLKSGDSAEPFVQTLPRELDEPVTIGELSGGRGIDDEVLAHRRREAKQIS